MPKAAVQDREGSRASTPLSPRFVLQNIGNTVPATCDISHAPARYTPPIAAVHRVTLFGRGHMLDVSATDDRRVYP